MTDNCKPPFTVVSNKPDLRVVTPMPLYVMAREIAQRYGAAGAIILIRTDHGDGTLSTRMGMHNLTRSEEREMLCDAMAIVADQNIGGVTVHYEGIVDEEDGFVDPNDAA